ncbi:uncharacterized protein LOC142983210 [Anticarsia gemmatalis]|uniref:uncharacterized protein LOC142983210 n=1 Tax=Anticarsia gemmatalis TaxID=129554 RepID=UPI003F75DEC5
MNFLVAFACLVASASAKDLILGRVGGKLIFESNETASPAIWKQIKVVTVSAAFPLVISHVAVTDKRDDKNGEAKITEGGVGHQNVSIELKSPTILRGYDFEIKVFADKEGSQFFEEQDNQTIGQGVKKQPGQKTTDQVAQVPAVPKVQHPHPVDSNKDVKEQQRPGRHTGQEEPSHPAGDFGHVIEEYKPKKNEVPTTEGTSATEKGTTEVGTTESRDVPTTEAIDKHNKPAVKPQQVSHHVGQQVGQHVGQQVGQQAEQEKVKVLPLKH